MSYSIKSNRCEGTHQPLYRDGEGALHLGAKWPTYQEAYEAIVFHVRNGLFPSEVVEKTVNLCHACRQPLPD